MMDHIQIVISLLDSPYWPDELSLSWIQVFHIVAIYTLRILEEMEKQALMNFTQFHVNGKCECDLCGKNESVLLFTCQSVIHIKAIEFDIFQMQRTIHKYSENGR